LIQSVLRSGWPALLLAIIAAIIAYGHVGDGLFRFGYDLVNALKPVRASENIVIIYLDEKSHRDFEQPPDRIWDRELHARLLERLTREGARIVIYDILFDQASSDASADGAFVDAISGHGNVILGASFQAQKNLNTIQRTISPPHDKFMNAARDWGFLILDPLDPDFGVRRINSGTETLKTATWLAAEYLDSSFADANPARLKERWINFLGPPGTVTSVSFTEAFREDGVPSGFFKDKVILIGGKYAAGLIGDARDSFRSPYSLLGHPFIPGVELHANILASLLQGKWLNRMPAGAEVGVVFLIAFLSTLLIVQLRPRFAFVVTALCILAVTIAGFQGAWKFRILFNWMVPVAVQLPAALFISVGRRYYVERKRRNRLKTAFSSYLSPVMAEKISDSGFDPRQGGEMKDITTMFTDLQSFTSLSESANPEEIVEILNTYFDITTKGILEKKRHHHQIYRRRGYGSLGRAVG